MNSLIKLFVIAATVAVIGQLMHSAYAMYEDQVMICNFEDNCQVVSIDDYMDKEQAATLWNNFNQELDTFDLKDASN